MKKASFAKHIGLAAIIAASILNSNEAKSQVGLPEMLMNVRVTEVDASYFRGLENTPEMLNEKIDYMIRNKQYNSVIDLLQKASVYAYLTKNREMYTNMLSRLENVTNEKSFIDKMKFGNFVDSTGRLLVYDYLKYPLENDTLGIMRTALVQGRGRIATQAHKMGLDKKKHFFGDSIQVFGYDKYTTLFIYRCDMYGSKKATKKLIERLNEFHYNTPFSQSSTKE